MPLHGRAAHIIIQIVIEGFALGEPRDPLGGYPGIPEKLRGPFGHQAD